MLISEMAPIYLLVNLSGEIFKQAASISEPLSLIHDLALLSLLYELEHRLDSFKIWAHFF